jgi:hypothetical protein
MGTQNAVLMWLINMEVVECILSNKKVFHETTHMAKFMNLLLRNTHVLYISIRSLTSASSVGDPPLEGFNIRIFFSTSDTTTLYRRISGLGQRWIASTDISRMKNGSEQTTHALRYPTQSDSPPAIHIAQELIIFGDFPKC